MTTAAIEIELEPLSPVGGSSASLLRSALPFLDSVKVPVTVRVGSAESSVSDLLALQSGAVLRLDRLVDQPLDIVVFDHVVARGTLVAIGENFGVRITEPATYAGGEENFPASSGRGEAA